MQLNLHDIALLVKNTSNITIENIKLSKGPHARFGRLLIMVLANEEEIPNQKTAQFLGIDKSNVTRGLQTADKLLKDDLTFKEMYLSAINKIAEMEAA